MKSLLSVLSLKIILICTLSSSLQAAEFYLRNDNLFPVDSTAILNGFLEGQRSNTLLELEAIDSNAYKIHSIGQEWFVLVVEDKVLEDFELITLDVLGSCHIEFSRDSGGAWRSVDASVSVDASGSCPRWVTNYGIYVSEPTPKCYGSCDLDDARDQLSDAFDLPGVCTYRTGSDPCSGNKKCRPIRVYSSSDDGVDLTLTQTPSSGCDGGIYYQFCVTNTCETPPCVWKVDVRCKCVEVGD
jgi:hypothetical protein